MATPLLAAVQNLGEINGIGPLGNIPDLHNSTFRLELTLSKVIGVVTIAAGIWFLVQLILAAFSWLTSGGDKQAVQLSQKKLTSALIGLLIVIMSYSLAVLVGAFLGFPLMNVGNLIERLVPAA